MAKEVILLKLGEVVLKGLNRRTFEDALLKSLRRRLKSAGEFTVNSLQCMCGRRTTTRIWTWPRNAAPGCSGW